MPRLSNDESEQQNEDGHVEATSSNPSACCDEDTWHRHIIACRRVSHHVTSYHIDWVCRFRGNTCSTEHTAHEDTHAAYVHVSCWEQVLVEAVAAELSGRCRV